jgi:hypothetical protein
MFDPPNLGMITVPSLGLSGWLEPSLREPLRLGDHPPETRSDSYKRVNAIAELRGAELRSLLEQPPIVK